MQTSKSERANRVLWDREKKGVGTLEEEKETNGQNAFIEK